MVCSYNPSAQETEVGEVAVSSTSAHATEWGSGQPGLRDKPLAFKSNTSRNTEKKKSNMAKRFLFSPCVLHWVDIQTWFTLFRVFSQPYWKIPSKSQIYGFFMCASMLNWGSKGSGQSQSVLSMAATHRSPLTHVLVVLKLATEILVFPKIPPDSGYLTS